MYLFYSLLSLHLLLPLSLSLSLSFPSPQGIQAPLNADKDLLVQMILGHQARVLTERAQKAVQQISHAHRAEDVLSVDPRTLEPPTTAYSCSSSSSSRLNQSLPGSTAQSTSMDIRSRVRAHIQLRKVCVCINKPLLVSPEFSVEPPIKNTIGKHSISKILDVCDRPFCPS